MPFSSMTLRVWGRPLDSPSVMLRAPRSWSSVINFASVSGCVDPGASSAELTFGFNTTRLPGNGPNVEQLENFGNAAFAI